MITILYATIITVPLGLAYGWAGKGATLSLSVSGIIVLGAGLGLIPWLLGAPSSPAWQWPMTGLAFLAGAMVRRRSWIDATAE